MNKSGYEINYSFEYKGYKDDYYFYSIPYSTLCEAIRNYFSQNSVDIDGTNNAIWNSLINLGEDVIESIVNDQQEWLEEKCREQAFEDFKDEVEELLSDNE